MKRTILSSFMFLYPLNKAYEYRDVATMNWSAIGLGLSVCNHSHSWHTDWFRIKLFQWTDVAYMHAFTLRTIYNSLTSIQCASQSVLIGALMILLYYYTLGDKSFEQYKSIHKNIHMGFHVFSIASLTLLHQRCYWDKYFIQ